MIIARYCCVAEIASRKPSVSFPLSPGRADASTSPEPTTPQTALSVIVPASYRDEQSLPTSPLPPSPDPAVQAACDDPLPPAPDVAPTPLPTSPNCPSSPSTPPTPNMGSSASKLMRSLDKKSAPASDSGPASPGGDPAASDVSITLTIEKDDGRRVPVTVDMGEHFTKILFRVLLLRASVCCSLLACALLHNYISIRLISCSMGDFLGKKLNLWIVLSFSELGWPALSFLQLVVQHVCSVTHGAKGLGWGEVFLAKHSS